MLPCSDLPYKTIMPGKKVHDKNQSRVPALYMGFSPPVDHFPRSSGNKAGGVMKYEI